MKKSHQILQLHFKRTLRFLNTAIWVTWAWTGEINCKAIPVVLIFHRDHHSTTTRMDTSGSSAGQVPALNVVFPPAPPTSTATVVEQPSCIAEEYRKVHTGVTDFVDTVGKILRESGHGLDDDRLSKLLFSLGSLPLTSEAELSQNAQQLTCFILTALTVIAEIMKKTVIKHPTSAEPQASSSEGGDHSSMKKVEHKEPQDSSGEGGDHISMKTEEHVKEESIQTQLSNISTLQQICIRISTPATSPDNTDPAFSNSLEKHEGTSQRSQPTNCRKRGRPRKSFVCSVCFVSFSVETDLKTHMLDHTVTKNAHESTLQGNQPTNCRKRGRPGKSFCCSVCFLLFSGEADLKTHMLDHTVTKDAHESTLQGNQPTNCRKRGRLGKSVCCSVCFLSFSVEADLKTHTLSHTVAQDSHSHESAVQGDPPTNCRKRGRPRKSFCCSVCFLSFSVEADLKTHMLDHSEDASSVCNATPSPVRKKQGRPRKSLSCDFCPQAFINRDQVLRHMHAHHEADLKLQRSLKKDVPKRPVGRPLQSRVCDFCFKVFSRRSAVVSHMRNHHPEQMNYTRKLYTCTECGQSIKSKAGYNRHMLKHQGCRPFSCTQCDKSFYLSRELKTHIIGVHEGVRPYLCAVCGAAFKRGHALHMHMVLHKGVKKHVCQDCGKAFPERFRLNRHMAVHKTEKPYKCEYCPAKYSLNTCLKVHLQRSKFCPGSKAVSQTH